MNELVRYDAACRAIAEAKSVDEVKDVRDKAVAMAAYARQAKNRDLESDAVEIRLRATRRIDQLRQAQKESVGLNQGAVPGKTGLKTNPVLDPRPTLASQGIDKNLAHQARTLGALSDEKFESVVAAARDAVARATKTVMRAAKIEEEREEYGEGVADGCTVDDLDALISAGKKFGVIYADPPWTFNVYSGKGKQRSADRYYNTMSLDDIKALPVQQLAADDCALMMWCVSPELDGALDVIQAWGFEYKTVGLCWVKQTKGDNGLHWGMGYWTRANVELCLLATRGAPKRMAKDVHQVIEAPVSQHSRKPDEAQVRIERLLNGPYLELFGRRASPNWTVWGNQISRSLFHQNIPEFAA